MCKVMVGAGDKEYMNPWCSMCCGGDWEYSVPYSGKCSWGNIIADFEDRL